MGFAALQGASGAGTGRRLTSEGVPGIVHVDESTYRKIGYAFDFQPPLTLYLKGKGETAVYRVIGRKGVAQRLSVEAASAAG